MNQTKLSKQQKKILNSLEMLSDTGKTLSTIDPRYKDLKTVNPMSKKTKSKKPLIPIRYINRMHDPFWRKQTPKKRASFSRSIKRLHKRGLIDRYTVEATNNRRIKCINLSSKYKKIENG